VLRPVTMNWKAKDGFVSLEVSPYLAVATKGTIAEAVAGSGRRHAQGT